ncbi:hypothetical protein AMECASPLE_008723, partial [Ameca splendens]
MHQPGNQAWQAIRSRPSTTRQLPQTQDMLHRPTHPTANHSPVVGARQGAEPQKEALEEGHHSLPRTGHHANPTPKLPEVPQDAGQPTLPHGTPCSTKQAGHPLHQSESTSQSTLHTARPRPPRRSLAPPNSFSHSKRSSSKRRSVNTVM